MCNFKQRETLIVNQARSSLRKDFSRAGDLKGQWFSSF